jgi:sRNA-binding regulator protein Hfq
MSETHETATADMDQAIPRLAGDIAPFDDAQVRLRPGGKNQLFYKMLHNMQNFCKKR